MGSFDVTLSEAKGLATFGNEILHFVQNDMSRCSINQHIASFLGAGSILLVLPSLYGAYFLLFSDVTLQAIAIVLIFLVGCVLCAGYVQLARNRSFWLWPWQVWLGTILYNAILLALLTFSFVQSGLWCVTLWQLGAVSLASIVLYRDHRRIGVR
ncbi:MAG: hypothetical protein MI924_08305 [Chloroflexales bacterium]|nr:hypothetical protein [Chloroflexales bacterium]